MEYKRSMIIILLTIFIFSIASVCAGDVDDTLLAGGDSQLTDEIIQANENQEVEIQDMNGDDLNSNEDDSPIKDMDRLKDSNDKKLQESSITVTNHTFKAIQDAIDNGYDTIYLEEGIYNGTSFITIYRDNIRLIGVYNSTILDGKHQTRILEISGNNNVKIENITFINGQKSHGGAIYWDNSDNGNISNCNFINNSASYGGAIDWVGSNNGSISNCNFINNSAGMGGAFRWDNSNNGSISNCNFINNSADSGGAIYWEKSDNGNVSYCNFINNSANNVETIDWDGSDGSVSGCSFIDYNSDVIKSDGLLDANYCWFGKNATNYEDSLPILGDVDCKYILFLNAVADSTPLDPSGTVNVVFKLFLYNSTSGNVSEYDNSPFDYVNLEITKTNGNVSKNTTGLDDAITYTAGNSGKGSVTASIGNTSYTIEFDIKEESNLTVGSQEVYYSNNTILNLNYNSTATGKVNITLKGNKNDYNFKDIDLNKSISLGIISPDTYDVNISYSGDETFAPSNATGKLTVIPIVDLEIKIETDPLCEELYVNDTILFTVTVKNKGPCNATDVNVSEILSSLLEMVSYNTDAGDYDVNEGIWHIGNLSRDDCKVLNISARVISVGNITNEVNVTGAEYDSNLSNNRANISAIKALPLVDLEITKEVNSEDIHINDLIIFTITVKNNGPCDATDVNVSEILSTHLKMDRYVTWDSYYDVDEGIWYIGDLSNNDWRQLVIYANVSSVGNFTNEVNVTSAEKDSNISNNKARVEIRAKPIVDLSTNISSDSAIYFIGDLAKWTITVYNAGNGSNATNIELDEWFPSQYFEFVVAIPDIGTYNETSKVWKIESLENGTNATLIIYGYATAAHININNRVVVVCDEDDWDIYNNLAYNYVDVIDIPEPAITASNYTPYYNDEIIYTIDIKNNESVNYTGLLTVTDRLPDGMDLIQIEGVTGAEEALPVTIDGGNITWYLTNINSGSSAQITFRVKVGTVGNLNNNLTIDATFVDYMKTANCTVEAKPIVDISADILSDHEIYFIGDMAVWTIRVYNAGNGTNATNIVLEEFFPSQYFEYVASECNIGTYNKTSGEWNIESLENGTNATLNIAAYAKVAHKNVNNRVVVATDEDDWDIYNNLAYNYVDVIDIPEPAITASSYSPHYNDEIIYTIDIKNNESVNYTGLLTVTDSLPYGMDLIQIENVTGAVEALPVTIEGGNITWYLTGIENESTAQITFRVKVSQVGNLTNNLTIDATFVKYNKSVNCTVEAQPIVDLSVEKTAPDNCSFGDIITWTITVHNAANGTDATDVTLYDYFPGDYFEIINITTENGTVTENVTNSYYLWNIGFMANGTDATLVITSRATNAGEDILNYASVFSDEDEWDYENNVARKTVTVNKLNTELTGSAVSTTYNVNKNLVISLKDVNGNPLSGFNITVNLNGVKTYTTDSNGQVKVSTKGLSPKSYTAKISFDGDNNYENSSKEIKVTVKKANPKLTASTKTYKTSTKVKKYTITLKDNTGKAISKAKVTLKVNGKTYKATTNSKGKATFNIKLNKAGTFKATVTFNANKYYNKVTKKVNIKVISTFKTVSKGSKDKAMVKQIQQALKDNGYYLSYKGHYLKVDGIYHDCTVRSVKEFQRDKGLKVTGKVDEKTAKKLKIIS